MARSGKGGGKKRCTKGKSCGATCISRAKICLKDAAKPVAEGLGKLKSQIDTGKIREALYGLTSNAPLVRVSYGGTNSLTKEGLKALEQAEKMIGRGGKDGERGERLKRNIELQLNPQSDKKSFI